MTNAERQTHVIRILGTNKAGDVLPDIWVDVERIDRMEIMTQVIQPAGTVNQHQKVTIKLRWLDDPDGDYDPTADRNRQHRTVKVCDPSQTDLDDPDEFILIKSIQLMEVKHAGGIILKYFKESEPNSDIDSRVIANRRITHWETTIDDAAQAAFDADPTRKVYVEPDGNRKYERIENTEDESQYVEHQIVEKLNRQDSQQLLSTGNDQRRVLYLRNQYQIDESRPAKLKELGKDDINPPYRLDPFQNIVNVQWGTGQQAVIGIANRTNDSTNNQNRYTTLSKDGHTFTTGFGAGTTNAASGLGYTVIGDLTSVAFGKPRDGAACFLTLSAGVVKRGVLNEDGELTFTTLSGAPGGGSLSFAGEAFFLGLGADYGVSFDGTTFETVSVFPRSETDPTVFDPDGRGISSGSPVPGHVAYDKETSRYVTTGFYTRWYDYTYMVGDDEFESFTTEQNFMSSRSDDGITWADQYDVSEGVGLGSNVTGAIGGGQSQHDNVTFGKGLFVAATTFKGSATPPLDSGPNYYPACAIATSTNGSSWTNRRLPNTIGRHVFEAPGGTMIDGGNGMCVKFFKTSGTGGFFIATGTERVERYPIPSDGQYAYTGKLWYSEDGLSWSLAETLSWKAHHRLSAIGKSITPDSPKLFYL